MKRFAAFLFLAFSVPVIAQAQNGTIRGTVTNLTDAETLIGVPIRVLEDMTKYGITDLDGRYSISIPAGTYTLVCSYVGYIPDTVKVDVKAGEVTVKDFVISDVILKKEFVVQAKRDQGAIGTAIQEKKQAGSVTDIQGREQISQSGASNAASAAAKAPGVSVEGGKYVYVRGLSDRYSKTTLNGAEVPGLDPNRNSVQMDLFPANLIEKIKIYKSFSPDLPGSFTGGLVNIETRDFPEDLTVLFSASLGFNTQATFNANFLSESEGNLDWLGFSAGSRDLPDNFPVGVFPNIFSGDDELIDEVGKNMSKRFEPVKKRAFLNQSYSAAVGDQFKAGKGEKAGDLGYIAGISYSNKNTFYDDGIQGRYQLTGTQATTDILNTELNLNDIRGENEVIWGALGNISYKINTAHKIGLTASHFQSGSSLARFLEGANPNDAQDLFFQTRTMMWEERGLTTGQLQGDHLFGFKPATESTPEKKGVKMDWIASATTSTQETPNLRYFTNDYIVSPNNDTTFNLQSALYNIPASFYRFMTETNYDIKLNFEIPFKTLKGDDNKGKDGRMKFGGSTVIKDRLFSEKRYDFNEQSGPDMDYNGSVADYLADENFEIGNPGGYLYISDASERRNSYNGDELVIAGYGMGDFYVLPNLRLLLGARVEKAVIESASISKNLPVGQLDNLDLLPAFNATYGMLNDTLKFRVAYSRTLARPTFRELAPFASFDFVGGNVSVGNDTLERTLIDNVDMRVEFYPKYDESISLGVFYKRFQNPIERAFNPEAPNPELTWRNVDLATVYGAEFEFRKGMGFLSKALKDLTLGGNFTYVYSEVFITEKEYSTILDGLFGADRDGADISGVSRTREMFGQSPYIVNAFLNYKNDSSGIELNVNFGVAGTKLAVVTPGATPNVYEKPRPDLGFNISKSFGKHRQYGIRLSGANLLNSALRQVYTYKDVEYDFVTYRTGQTFTVTFRYELDKAKRN